MSQAVKETLVLVFFGAVVFSMAFLAGCAEADSHAHPVKVPEESKADVAQPGTISVTFRNPDQDTEDRRRKFRFFADRWFHNLGGSPRKVVVVVHGQRVPDNSCPTGVACHHRNTGEIHVSKNLLSLPHELCHETEWVLNIPSRYKGGYHKAEQWEDWNEWVKDVVHRWSKRRHDD